MAMYGNRMLTCPGVEMFLDSQDDLYLLPIAGRDQLKIQSPWGRWVCKSLRGEPVADMPLELADEVARIMVWLESETYVRNELDVRSPETARWDRQVQWFAQETGDGPGRQDRLARAKVLVLGVGGLGCTVANLLARAGVGSLILADHDVVDESNLQRQLLYTAGDVGRYKVDAAADHLCDVAPDLHVSRSTREVTGSPDMAELLDAYDPDLVVCAADHPPISIKTWVEDAAAVHGTAVVHGGHRPPLVYAGPFFIPGISCCYECFSRSRMRPGTEQLEIELGIYRDIVPPKLPAVGWGDTAAASLIAGQSVQWLAGIASVALQGRELELDLRTLESRWMDGPTVPQCLRCDAAESRAHAS